MTTKSKLTNARTTTTDATSKGVWGEHVERADGVSLVKPAVTPNALAVLEKRYLGRDRAGNVKETVHDMWWRVASDLAKAETEYGASEERVRVITHLFYNMMAGNKFLPNSPTIMNAGRELQQLSACFVLPVPDDIPGIFEAIKQQAIIHKTGGGTGFSFSRIRGKNSVVGSTGGIASGPVSFMRIFNTATEQIKQGGTRRGANMAILRCDHPDVMDFVDMKLDLKEMTNFNVSVAITDDFMKALHEGGEYALIDPNTQERVGSMDPQKLMDRIANNAWTSGEPGIFFIDRANATNPVPHIADIEATNPCGEQDLMPYDSCNLGSIVLDNHMEEVKSGQYEVDWAALRETVWQSVRLLDNVIDRNDYPLPQIRDMSNGTRRIGLGIMGFARMLFKLNVAYDSEEGLKWARDVMRFIQEEGVKASEALAQERGPYGFWEGSVHEQQGLTPRRNSYVTTIAPTGTISMIADTSGGCEPEFSLIWYKNVMDGTHLPYTLDLFEQVAKREGFWYEGLMEDVLKNKGRARGLAKVPEHWQRVFATSMDIAPEWHVRMQAAFQEHVDAAVSKTINMPKDATEEDVKKAYKLAYDLGCKGITVYRDGSRQDQVLNLGKSEKKADASAAKPRENSEPKSYLETHRHATMVFNGSQENNVKTAVATLNKHLKPEEREQVVIAMAKDASNITVQKLAKQLALPAQPERGTRMRSSDVVEGVRVRVPTGWGELYVNTDFEEGSTEPCEVFANLGKEGGFTRSLTEALGRAISIGLQHGTPATEFVRQFSGIRSPKGAILPGGIKVLSVPDGIALALTRAIERREKMLRKMRVVVEPEVEPAATVVTDESDPVTEEEDVTMTNVEADPGALVNRGENPECPDCGMDLALQEGCIKCRSCGYSEC